MIQIVLASHGDFCLGLKQSLEMIAGKTSDLVAMPFRLGEDPQQYRDELSKVLGKRTTLVLVDLKGGTPYNSALFLSSEKSLKVVTGVNLPMLLAVVTSRNEHSKIQELVDIVTDSTNSGIEEMSLGGSPHREKLSVNKN
ncbi:MAG: PTS sugar transporter subunit IIA [Lactobacillus sp.]|nr:PTS sugar transporter subunit IIA [Lactobacillus sp.]MDN6052593.1 PTS sugar transporter subunit IIA [Lactobacillus sp.]